MTYSFDVEIAQKYGAEEAIILHNLLHWIAKNRANGKHFYEGTWWTYNSVKAFAELFPFWTEKQIRRILHSLLEKGAIKTARFNKASYDQTTWYSIRDQSIFPNGQGDFPKREAGFSQTGEPIPDGKPDRKPDGKGEAKRFTPPTIEQCREYGREIEISKDESESFWRHHEQRDWKIPAGRNLIKMSNWKLAMQTWKKNAQRFAGVPVDGKPERPKRSY